MSGRRHLLRALSLATLASLTRPGRADFQWSTVAAGTPIRFPRDHGAHPDYRTEWWYLTAVMRDAQSRDWGLQLTFFRSRTRHSAQNPSRFAPTQLLFAHAALAAPEASSLMHDDLAARRGFGLAEYSEDDLSVSLEDWKMFRDDDGRIQGQIRAQAFSLDVRSIDALQPRLQGQDGYSRKGPRPEQASHYYSVPQLALEASVGPGRARSSTASTMIQQTTLRGRGWLDHEWSSEILDERASGWDWVGLNFDDGRALMAFRIRLPDGNTLWRTARWFEAERGHRDAEPVFEALRWWRSPRSGTDWPVSMRLRIDGLDLKLEPILDDQEVDARRSTGTLYWEGAMQVIGADGTRVGAGYLELTGYAGTVTM